MSGSTKEFPWQFVVLVSLYDRVNPAWLPIQRGRGLPSVLNARNFDGYSVGCVA